MSQICYGVKVILDNNTAFDDIVAWLKNDKEQDWGYCFNFDFVDREEHTISSGNSCHGRDFEPLSKAFPECIFDVEIESLSCGDSIDKEIYYRGEHIISATKFEAYDDEDDDNSDDEDWLDDKKWGDWEYWRAWREEVCKEPAIQKYIEDNGIEFSEPI